jgi:hypothetical protein
MENNQKKPKQVKFHFNPDNGSISLTFFDRNYSFFQRLKHMFVYVFTPEKYKTNFVVSPKDVDLLVKIVIRAKISKQKRK